MGHEQSVQESELRGTGLNLQSAESGELWPDRHSNSRRILGCGHRPAESSAGVPFGVVMINRRSLLLSPLAAVLLPRRTYAAQLASLHGEIYRQLGVRPLINAAGTYTTLTGSLLVPQAREAMM